MIGKEGEYPTSLWYCVATLYQVHDLWSDIHMFEVSSLYGCIQHHYSIYSWYAVYWDKLRNHFVGEYYYKGHDLVLSWLISIYGENVHFLVLHDITYQDTMWGNEPPMSSKKNHKNKTGTKRRGSWNQAICSFPMFQNTASNNAKTRDTH